MAKGMKKGSEQACQFFPKESYGNAPWYFYLCPFGQCLARWPHLAADSFQVSISLPWENSRVDLLLKQSRELTLLQGFQPASQESQGDRSSEF